MLHTRSGRRVLAASFDGTKLDEFEVRIVPSGHSSSSRENRPCLTARSSMAASMTKSADAAAASSSVVNASRANAASRARR
jgi:hypothetical protein